MTQAPFPQAITNVMGDLRRFAMMLTRDPAMRDDLVQETVLRALENRDLLKDPEGLRAWLFQIMRRRLIDLRRTAQARAGREDALQWIRDDHQPAMQDMQVRLGQIRAAFAHLPPTSAAPCNWWPSTGSAAATPPTSKASPWAPCCRGWPAPASACAPLKTTPPSKW